MERLRRLVPEAAAGNVAEAAPGQVLPDLVGEAEQHAAVTAVAEQPGDERGTLQQQRGELADHPAQPGVTDLLAADQRHPYPGVVQAQRGVEIVRAAGDPGPGDLFIGRAHHLVPAAVEAQVPRVLRRSITLLTAADYEDMRSYGAYTFFRVCASIASS